MNRIYTRISLFLMLTCLGIGTSFAQTFCLQMTEVSNDGVNSVVSIGVQGDASFIIGSSNLQLAYTAGAFGTPTLVSSPLAPPFYFAPTVTEPGPGQASLNIELAFSDASGTIAAAPGFTEVAVINFPIANATLAADGVVWQYNGGTTATVVFLDDEATQLLATTPTCLTGYTPNPPAVVPDCPTLGTPADLAIDVPAAAGVDFAWTNATTGGAAEAIDFLIGTDPAALQTIALGVQEAVQITGIDFATTYFYSVVPTNSTGAATGCSVFSFTTEDAPPGGTNVSCATATPIGEGTFTDLGPLSGAGASNLCGTGATNASWYEYTATVTGLATISSSIDLDLPDTRISVHSACDNLDCLAFDDDGGDGFTSITSLEVVAGETYYLEWDDRWSAGEFDFEISVLPPLAGCTDATACNYNDAATTDDGSCVLPTGCDTCSGETDGTGTVVPGPTVGDACDDGDPATTGETIGSDCVCAVQGVTGCGGGLVAVDGVQTSTGILALGGVAASNACFTGATNSIFYEYVATSTGIATISSSIDLDQPDTRVSVHSDCATLDCLASDDDGGEGFTSIATLNVVAGENYFIEWDDRWDDGEFDFEISIAPLVDGCTDALACNYNDAANNDDGSCVLPTGCDTCSGETDGTGTVVDNPEVGDACDDGNANTIDDVIQADCVTCLGTPLTFEDGQLCDQAIVVTDGITTSLGVDSIGYTAIGACATGTSSVWYEYVATCTGIVTVSSSIDLDLPDTQVHIYADCDSTCIASDDDGGDGFTSIVTFESVAGETYHVEWDDRWDGGEFDFEISCAPAVNGCTDATACNYNDAANIDDASCVFATGCDACSGETDGTGTVIDNPEVGEACDDGNANTINDIVGADCVCSGDPLNGCKDVTACNYNADPAVGEDNTLCIFATGCDTCSGETDGTGTVVDNPEVGEACDDADVATLNDVVQADCFCAGTLGSGPGSSCAVAITVEAGVVTTSAGTAALGGGSASLVCFPATAAVNAVWYEYTATSCDTVTVSSSIDLDLPDTRLSIHTGGDCAVLDCIASDDDGGDGFTSVTTFVGMPGQTYFIEWDDRWDDGEFDFVVSTPVDTCPTDFTGDGTTDGEDFSIFLGNFGLPCVDMCDCPTDFNGDGVTDGEDFSIFLGNFGLDCPTTN